jgi:uncharacterized phage protein gp47/JayE
MGQLTNTGYTVKTLAEWKTLIQAAFQAGWPGIVITEETPEGIWTNELAEWLTNSDTDGLNIFNQMNLNNASGAFLSFIAVIRGTERNDGTKALLTVTLTSSTQPYTIASGTQFTLSGTSLIFETTTSVTVNALSKTGVQLQAVLNGVTAANVGDKLSSVTTISPLTDIAITSIVEGTENETDTELRLRLRTQNSLNANGEVGDIYAALRNLSNTTKAVVYENDTATTDSRSIPSKHINAVVLGSTTQEIVDVIGVKKSGGTPTYGAASGTFTDTQGDAHTIYFDRPTQERIYIAASVTAKPGQAIPDASYNTIIRSNCKTFVNDLDIGQDVSYTTVFGFFAFPAVNVSPFDITALKMSTSPTAGFAATNVSVGDRIYAYLSDENVDITITTV